MAALVIGLLATLIPHIYAVDYTCPTGADCSIISNTTQRFYQSTITCPTGYACNVLCTDPTTANTTDTSHQTCQEATILASSSTVLTLTCDGLANCQNLNLVAPNGMDTFVNIDCDGIGVCKQAQFELNAADYVSIHCNSAGSCNGTRFAAQASKDTTAINEMHIEYDSIHAGDESLIYCGDICVISAVDQQSNIEIYSEAILYGENVLLCEQSDCFPNAQILCEANYSSSCDIDFANDEYSCSQCLNRVFDDHSIPVNVNLTSDDSENDDVYSLKVRQIFYETTMYLLTDIYDRYYVSIAGSDCNCVNNLDEYIAMQVTDESMGSSFVHLSITTDQEILYNVLNTLFVDIRFNLTFEGNMQAIDETFTLQAISIRAPTLSTTAETHVRQEKETIIQGSTYLVIVVLSLVLIIAVIGTVQMYYYDVTIYVTGILMFGLYTWDFYSDMLFSYEVYETYAKSSKDVFLVLFVLCLLFLVAPIITSIFSLFRFQDKWATDKSIGEHIKGWNRDWSTYLLFLTIVSGSSHAAVNMLNSRVFGHPLFCMGLSYRHLKKFENQRLWGVILSENIPQLIIQGVYFGQADQALSDILLLAFASSLLSIVVAAVDIYNNKRLFGQFAKGDDYHSIVKVPVISPEVGEKQWKLSLATHRFNDVFAKIIGVDKYAIEVDLPSPNANGLVINFSIRTVDTSPKEILAALTRAQKNGSMAKGIQEAWKLQKPPLIGAVNLEQIGARKDEEVITELPIESLNPLSSDASMLEDIEMVNKRVDLQEADNGDRTNTVKAKPYEPVDKLTKAKVLSARKMTPGSPVSEEDASSSALIKGKRSHMQMDTVASMSESNFDKSIEKKTRAKHAESEPPKPALPRQKTGLWAKKVRELEENPAVKVSSSRDLVATSSITVDTSVSSQPKSLQGQQTQQIMQYASSPNFYANQQQRHVHNNSYANGQNAAMAMQQNKGHAVNHGHAQTMASVPYNVQYQQYAQQHGHAGSMINFNQMQQHWQQNAQMHSMSAGNFHAMAQQQQQMYQQQQQQQQQPVQGVLHEDEEVEHDHESFVPPAPHQEVDKFVQYKVNRQLRDEERKLRLQQEREAKRMENQPNVKKIESVNAEELQPSGWSQMNAQPGNGAYSQNLAGHQANQFSQNLGQHGAQESNDMEDILNDMYNKKDDDPEDSF